mgnify:CR=1 FL=1
MSNKIDWELVREECVSTGKIVKIAKEKDYLLPSFFHESNLGLSKGAIRQYRDERSTHTLHIHEFPDYFLAHVDAFNPEYHPVAHGFVDIPGMMMTIALGAIGLFMVAKTVHSLAFVPDDDDYED